MKVAMITGAYQGIGYATCELLLAKGYAVVMADIQDCSEKAAQFRQSGHHAIAVDLNLADSTTFTAAYNVIQSKFGQLDVLVNNAAILKDFGIGPIELQEQMLRDVLEINQIGPFLLTQSLVPLLKKSKAPRIVNLATQVAQLEQLSDMNSPLKDDICAAYQMSKVGVNANTVLFAKALEPFNGKVNSCCPGWVETDMNLDDLPDYGEAQERPKTVKEGADTPAWLATLDENGPTAGFFTDRQRINW
ncbi:SDR family NAD(P)-dependent oxidoreductase [Vibrio methylphosphonaticus]|uniref:SDR family NAD(P)-dependent oxidoreductase n=1 Tax=Vibrio methylphosphonaticus TaxID=2946866 RepID=UPI002029BED7|nr:SDR family NAD(P)-dependent oxidoreductase [Vibrio methylphosphonaticus]MCL9775668.1 SDR family NAD(P)-dependent oxidoreductase [Vibrio methylphosphonaticus]